MIIQYVGLISAMWCINECVEAKEAYTKRISPIIAHLMFLFKYKMKSMQNSKFIKVYQSLSAQDIYSIYRHV